MRPPSIPPLLQVQTAITENREQYTTLVEIHDETEWCYQGGTATNYSLAAAVFQTIDEDVNRTNVRDSAERERIRRVLRTFSLKNPSTGYCQVNNCGGCHHACRMLGFDPIVGLPFDPLYLGQVRTHRQPKKVELYPATQTMTLTKEVVYL